MYKMQDVDDPVTYKKRDRELISLTRLLSRALDVSGYWHNAQARRKKITNFFNFDQESKRLVHVGCSTSCGAFTMMYVDRMIYDLWDLPLVVGDNFIKNYRTWVGG